MGGIGSCSYARNCLLFTIYYFLLLTIFLSWAISGHVPMQGDDEGTMGRGTDRAGIEVGW